MPAPSVTLSSRLSSLDGLRGIAALAVLLEHALLSLPAVWELRGDAWRAGQVDLLWWFTYTPLHLAWAGDEAVHLFFVLSGIVLCLPVLRAGRYSWISYYPKRILRLYLPVWASIAITAIIVCGLLSGDPSHIDRSFWGARPDALGPPHILRDATLIGGVSGTNEPLWSLRWEVWFSLLLPIYVLFARFAQRKVYPAIIVAALLVVANFVDLRAYNMLTFAVGAVIAANLTAFVARVRVLPRAVLWVALGASVALITSRWALLGVGVPEDATVDYLWVTMIGIVGLVLVTLAFHPVTSFFESPILSWLGRISFSLYLTHIPALTVVRLLLPGEPAIAAAIAIPFALLVSELFFRAVESPAHRLSQLVGRRIADADTLRRARKTIAAAAAPRPASR